MGNCGASQEEDVRKDLHNLDLKILTKICKILTNTFVTQADCCLYLVSLRIPHLHLMVFAEVTPE